MRGLRIAAAALVVLASVAAASAATEKKFSIDRPDIELQAFVQELEAALPPTWQVVETGTDRVPIGWSGPAEGLYVMLEDTGTRFFHPNGFHYYSFYRIWLLPPSWEGEMRHTPYVSDSAPAFLLGMNDRYIAFYHTAGGNVWEKGPSTFCHVLGLDTICYTDLNRRTVDLEIEKRLTGSMVEVDGTSFRVNPYRIVGLTGEGTDIYLEYVFTGDTDAADDELKDLTEMVAMNVFEQFPEVDSLYLRRCTRDTFTDTILNRD